MTDNASPNHERELLAPASAIPSLAACNPNQAATRQPSAIELAP